MKHLFCLLGFHNDKLAIEIVSRTQSSSSGDVRLSERTEIILYCTRCEETSIPPTFGGASIDLTKKQGGKNMVAKSASKKRVKKTVKVSTFGARLRFLFSGNLKTLKLPKPKPKKKPAPVVKEN